METLNLRLDVCHKQLLLSQARDAGQGVLSKKTSEYTWPD